MLQLRVPCVTWCFVVSTINVRKQWELWWCTIFRKYLYELVAWKHRISIELVKIYCMFSQLRFNIRFDGKWDFIWVRLSGEMCIIYKKKRRKDKIPQNEIRAGSAMSRRSNFYIPKKFAIIGSLFLIFFLLCLSHLNYWHNLAPKISIWII